MRRNNIVRIDGLLAQETVELISIQPVLRVRVAVDTAAPDAGGRHYVLFEDKRAVVLAAYLAAAQAAGAPLPVSVSGSLRHERRMSLLTDLAEASFGTFRGVRNRAEEMLKLGTRLLPAPGPQHPLGKGYHSCAYLGGILDLQSLAAREAGDGVVLIGTLDTGDPAAVGRHEVVFGSPQMQAPLISLREQRADVAWLCEVEANVWGRLYTMQGFTSIMASGIELPRTVHGV